MKSSIFLMFLFLLFLTNCSSYSVKLGRKCTKFSNDNTYEKSYIWVVNRSNLNTFDAKINKQNCAINGEKL